MRPCVGAIVLALVSPWLGCGATRDERPAAGDDAGGAPAARDGAPGTDGSRGRPGAEDAGADAAIIRDASADAAATDAGGEAEPDGAASADGDAADGDAAMGDAGRDADVGPDGSGADDLRIELTWVTPGAGAGPAGDLDLHVVHPSAIGADVDGDGASDGWFDVPYDCFWFNPGPNWGAPEDADDDPSLDLDDVDGDGPEIVTLPRGEPGASYRVGVHGWDDRGLGASLATLRVYVAGVLAYEAADIALDERDLWECCTIEWPGGAVTPVAAPGDGPRITPDVCPAIFCLD